MTDFENHKKNTNLSSGYNLRTRTTPKQQQNSSADFQSTLTSDAFEMIQSKMDISKRQDQTMKEAVEEEDPLLESMALYDDDDSEIIKAMQTKFMDSFNNVHMIHDLINENSSSFVIYCNDVDNAVLHIDEVPDFVHLGCSHQFKVKNNSKSKTTICRCDFFAKFDFNSFKQHVFQQLINPHNKEKTAKYFTMPLKERLFNVSLAIDTTIAKYIDKVPKEMFKNLYRAIDSDYVNYWEHMTKFELDVPDLFEYDQETDLAKLTLLVDRKFTKTKKFASFLFQDTFGNNNSTIQKCLTKCGFPAVIVQFYKHFVSKEQVVLLVFDVTVSVEGSASIDKTLACLQEQCRLSMIKNSKDYIYKEAPFLFDNNPKLHEFHKVNFSKYNDALRGQQYYISQLTVFKSMDYIVNKLVFQLSSKFTLAFNKHKVKIMNRRTYIQDNPAKFPQNIVNPLVEQVPDFTAIDTDDPMRSMHFKIRATNLHGYKYYVINCSHIIVDPTVTIHELVKISVPPSFTDLKFISICAHYSDNVKRIITNNPDAGLYVKALSIDVNCSFKAETLSQYSMINLGKTSNCLESELISDNKLILSQSPISFCNVFPDDSSFTFEASRARTTAKKRMATQHDHDPKRVKQEPAYRIDFAYNSQTSFIYTHLPILFHEFTDLLVARGIPFDPECHYFTTPFGPLNLDFPITCDDRKIQMHYRLPGGFEPALAPVPDPLGDILIVEDASTDDHMTDSSESTTATESHTATIHTSTSQPNPDILPDNNPSTSIKPELLPREIDPDKIYRTESKFRIISFNGRGGRCGMLKRDLKKIIKCKRPHIIHVCEYRLNRHIKLRNYKRFDLPFDAEYESDRQCVFIHKSIEDVTRITPKNKYIHLFKIVDHYITFAYVPPRIKSMQVVLPELQRSFKTRSLLVGDFNCIVPSLQMASNGKGKAFESLVMDQCYSFLNTPHISTKNNSVNVLDLALCHQSDAHRFSNFSVLHDTSIGTTSDHYPIFIDMQLKHAFIIPRQIRFNLLNSDPDLEVKFTTDIQHQIECRNINLDDINLTSDYLWDIFTGTIFNAGEKELGIIDSFKILDNATTATQIEYLNIKRDNIRKKLGRIKNKTRIKAFKSKLQSIGYQIKKEYNKQQRD